MSMGPSPVEREAQQYRQQFGAALPTYMNQGMNWMNQGFGQLEGVNGDIRNYISGIGKDPTSLSMKNYLTDVMSGKLTAAQGKAYNADAAQGQASTADAFGLAMRGQGFAQQFGSDLGGLALQQRNMQSVADRLASTDSNPFAVLNKGAMEDAAFQNAQGRQQLQSQLGAQGLDSASGSGAAALAALQFNTNKSVQDAYRQNAAQGAQFQQQGLGMAGGLYGQIGGLDLQRATTAGQLGLQGYQADIGNAQRYDAVNMSNAQLQTQANMQNAQMQNNANLQNAQLQSQASLQNAGMQNSWQQGALQGQLGLMQMDSGQQAQLLSLLSQNAGQYLNAGSTMWGAGLNGQQNYMANLNQAAQASAQGRGGLLGGLLQGGLGLAGTLLAGAPGAALGSMFGRMFTGGGGGGGGGGYQPTIQPPAYYGPSYGSQYGYYNR